MPEPEDTFDKLIENIENTTIKMVENDLVFRFQDLEEAVIRSTQDQEDSIPKLRVKEDIFKTETLQSCQLERSSFRSNSRISEWVSVCADENEEPVGIPTESDGSLLLTSVTAQLPGAMAEVQKSRVKHTQGSKAAGRGLSRRTSQG